MQTSLTSLRQTMLRIAHQSEEGHLASSFSVLDILWVLYNHILPNENGRFVLSKGHAALALYTILENQGVISAEDLTSFCKPGSLFEGHPNHRIPGVEFSTGSLGHGITMAAGYALGMRLLAAKPVTVPDRVFCLVGDGELNEGSVWETALLARKFKLGNLVVVVDYNRSSSDSLPMGDIEGKFRAFGWRTFEIDGHRHKQIHDALSIRSETVPTVIVARTTKGYGCATLENDPRTWHHRAPMTGELEGMLTECR